MLHFLHKKTIFENKFSYRVNSSVSTTEQFLEGEQLKQNDLSVKIIWEKPNPLLSIKERTRTHPTARTLPERKTISRESEKDPEQMTKDKTQACGTTQVIELNVQKPGQVDLEWRSYYQTIFKQHQLLLNQTESNK